MLNENSITPPTPFFPNAIELYFPKGFDSDYTENLSLLDRIVPVKQLTKLVIKNCFISFEQIIEILASASRMRTLVLESLCFDRCNHLVVKSNDKFRRISEMNVTKHITFENPCTVKDLELLFALCPHVEHLSINIRFTTIKPIAHFLFIDTNPNTRHLFLLCFLNCDKLWLMLWNRFLKSKRILDDYTLKLIDSKLYLWW